MSPLSFNNQDSDRMIAGWNVTFIEASGAGVTGVRARVVDVCGKSVVSPWFTSVTAVPSTGPTEAPSDAPSFAPSIGSTGSPSISNGAGTLSSSPSSVMDSDDGGNPLARVSGVAVGGFVFISLLIWGFWIRKKRETGLDLERGKGIITSAITQE